MKATNPKIFGLILAGGFSRRMGRDKAYLEFHGKPQVECVDELLRQCCAEVFLSKRADQKPYKNFPFINDMDQFAGHGPISGILSAMKQYPEVSWLVLACDLPYVNEEALQALLDHRDMKKAATAFVSSQDALPEPLCAIWEAHAYEHILKLFNEGTHCPRKILIKSDTHLLEQGNPRWLDNINTPQEYDQARK
jgi:molybdopterin-guanine dinucleotide biosynthesis protein A